MATLGERIGLRRKALKFSQEELSERVGIARDQISRYERDVNEPTASVLIALARELETTTDYLLGLSDVIDRPSRTLADLDASERELVRTYREKEASRRPAILEILKLAQ